MAIEQQTSELGRLDRLNHRRAFFRILDQVTETIAEVALTCQRAIFYAEKKLNTSISPFNWLISAQAKKREEFFEVRWIPQDRKIQSRLVKLVSSYRPFRPQQLSILAR